MSQGIRATARGWLHAPEGPWGSSSLAPGDKARGVGEKTRRRGQGVRRQEEKLLEMKSVHFIPEECSLFSWQQS